jgi:hypothetical protein
VQRRYPNLSTLRNQPATEDGEDGLYRRFPNRQAVEIPSALHCRTYERVSGWGWPDETQSWNWHGQEGKPLQVAVYSRCDSVRLELNRKMIGEKSVSSATKLTAKFDVPYQPGELRGRCKTLSVICLSSLRPSPSGVRRSEGERSEPSAAEPRRGKDAPRAKNWSRAGHRGFLLGCRETQPTQNPNDPPKQS